MGVYYFLRNLTQDKTNELAIPGRANCHFVAKMHWLDDEHIMEIFTSVININGWDMNDTIQAYPDYPEYPIIMYENGEVRLINTSTLGINADRRDDDEMNSSDSDYDSSSEEVKDSEKTVNDEPIMDDSPDSDDYTTKYPIPVIDNSWDIQEEDYDW